jgi:hypothetical protein
VFQVRVRCRYGAQNSIIKIINAGEVEMLELGACTMSERFEQSGG